MSLYTLIDTSSYTTSTTNMYHTDFTYRSRIVALNSSNACSIMGKVPYRSSTDAPTVSMVSCTNWSRKYQRWSAGPPLTGSNDDNNEVDGPWVVHDTKDTWRMVLVNIRTNSNRNGDVDSLKY